LIDDLPPISSFSQTIQHIIKITFSPSFISSSSRKKRNDECLLLTLFTKGLPTSRAFRGKILLRSVDVSLPKCKYEPPHGIGSIKKRVKGGWGGFD
jgi:hypothetical protein